MDVRKKIFTACALGGGFGAFLAHQIFYPSGWSVLLGFLVGGLVSYLTYDFGRVMAAIPEAWNKTVGIWHAFAPVFVIFGVCVSNVVFVVGVNVSMNALNFSQGTIELIMLILVFMLIYGFVVRLIYLIINEAQFDSLNERGSILYISKWMNPLALIFVVIPHSVFLIVKYGILFLPRFSCNLFILIHSELRLLCLLDGGLGAVAGTLIAGTLTGTLVGALAGGIFGVLNFEIVSRRILKLVPRQ